MSISCPGDTPLCDFLFFFSSRRRHTRCLSDWSSDVCSSDLIGSGGLSHEPPVPTLSHPDQAVRERITVRREPTAAEREAKTQRVMAAGRALAEEIGRASCRERV